ncbi:DedA family protein [Methylosoma difficile]
MEIITQFLHLLNVDQLVHQYGTLTYVILFLIVFMETGLVVMPLLPGDSLLFAAGAVAASTGALNPGLLIPLLMLAALLGDNLNYFVGKYFGKTIKNRQQVLFLKQEYLLKTEAFYAKHGGKTVIMARFIPIVRTIAPFVAGAGSMAYGKFIVFCIIGALLWVPSLTLLGYFFGNLAVVKQNFELVVFAIIGVSLLPVFWQVFKAKFLADKAG